MKLFKPETLASGLPAFLFMSFSGTADGSVDQAGSITALQLAVGILVFALYAVSHFRDRITTFLKSFFGGERREGTEDRLE